MARLGRTRGVGRGCQLGASQGGAGRLRCVDALQSPPVHTACPPAYPRRAVFCPLFLTNSHGRAELDVRRRQKVHVPRLAGQRHRRADRAARGCGRWRRRGALAAAPAAACAAGLAPHRAPVQACRRHALAAERAPVDRPLCRLLVHGPRPGGHPRALLCGHLPGQPDGAAPINRGRAARLPRGGQGWSAWARGRPGRGRAAAPRQAACAQGVLPRLAPACSAAPPAGVGHPHQRARGGRRGHAEPRGTRHQHVRWVAAAGCLPPAACCLRLRLLWPGTRGMRRRRVPTARARSGAGAPAWPRVDAQANPCYPCHRLPVPCLRAASGTAGRPTSRRAHSRSRWSCT